MKDIPPKILAIVNHGPNDYRLETLACPRPQARELLVKVEACGICGSDGKCMHGAAMYWSGENPGADSWVKTPVIPGHEFVGHVAAAGAGAEEHFGVKVGDRVTAEQIIPCGKCMFCKSGRYWMCEQHDIFGFQGGRSDGAMAEYMIFNQDCIVHKVPAELTLEDAAFIEPLACGIHAVERAQVFLRDVVVVAGAGPIGLGIIQTLALQNPKELIVLDLDNKRLELCRQFGASITLNPKDVDVVGKVKELTGGYGCDIYIEASGHPAGVRQGLEMIRRLGRFVEMSVFGEDVKTDWSVIGDRKELDILGTHLGPYCYPIAIDLLRKGKISARDIVTHKFALKDFAEAMEMASQPDKSIKVLLLP